MFRHNFAFFILFFLLTPANVFAAPTGGTIVQGAGNISSDKLNTNITQSSNRLDINWKEFSVGKHESVNFFQPNNNSIAINRITGGVPSQIDGAINANGRVFAINKSGITFGSNAKINVGSLIATTHDLQNNTGDVLSLETDRYAQIKNYGNISVSNGGFAVLAAPYVENLGTIEAKLGRIELASGTSSTIDLRGDDKILFTINDSANLLKGSDEAEFGINQGGSLIANSGVVNITAKKASEIVAGAINLDGLIDATSFTKNGDGGSIFVKSQEHIELTNNAVLDASALENGSGGEITAIAEKIAIAREDAVMRSRGGSLSGDGGRMEFSGLDKLFVLGGNFDAQAPKGKRGSILFDPTNVTIGSIGGGFPSLLSINQFADIDIGNGVILNTLLNAALADVTIQATNNVNIDSPLSFLNVGALLFDHLTIQAGNDININANISGLADFDIVMTADDATSPSNGGDGTGAITMADGVSIDVNGGTINLSAAEDITVGRLITTNTSNSSIQLTSSAGGIVDAGDTGGSDIVSAGRLVVNSASGFGDSGAIETTVDSVDITAGSGAIRLNDTGLPTFTNLSNGSAYDLDITVADSLTLSTGYTKTGTGALNFRVNGADKNLNVTAPLVTANGNIDLQATGNIDLNASADLTASLGNITVKADLDLNNIGTLTMADGTDISTTSGLLDISAGGNITLGRLTSGNATTSAITLTSTTGEIIDGGDTGGADIVASGGGQININSGNGIGHGNPIEADGTLLAISNTNVGGGNRNIEINSVGALALGLESLTHSGTGSLNINALGIININNPINRTGIGNVVMESTTGSISLDSAIVTASGGVTARAAENVLFTANGNITSTSGNVLLAADYDWGGGGVQNDGTGALTMADGSWVNSGLGTITATASENITVGRLVSTDTTATAISLTSASGGIMDGGDTGGVDIQAAVGGLKTTSNTGFGDSGAIETTVASVDISANNGAIRLIETDGLTLTNLLNNSLNDIELTAGGSLTLNSSLNRTGLGNLSISATGVNSDLTINNPQTLGSGLANFAAARNVIFGSNGDITSTSGNITVTANSDSSGIGALTMDDGTLINSGSGKITLLAGQDITLGGLLSTDTSSTAIQVTSTGGSIMDGGDTYTDIVTTAGSWVANAPLGIGVGNPIETNVSAVDLTSSGGVVQINETDSLNITNISGATGDVNVVAGDTITVAGTVNTTTGNTSITANGSGSINVNDALTATTGNVSLIANDNVAFAAGGDITISTGGDITVTADNDSDANGSGGYINMADGSVFNAGSGTVTLSADEDITIGRILTSNATNSAVQLTSTSGGIIDGGDLAGNDIEALSGRLTVTAATGFGSSNPLEINVNDLVINAGSGALRFIETGGYNVTTASNTNTYDLDMTFGGNSTIASSFDRSGAGNLTITVLGANNNLTVNSPQTTASGDITLKAPGDIAFGVNGDLTSTSGTLTITADTDSSGAGNINMDPGTMLNAGSGLVDMDAGGDITLGSIITTSSIVNAVTLDAGDNIYGNALNATNISVLNGGISMLADSIGTNLIPVQLDADQLTFTTRGGDAYFHTTDPVTFNPSTTNGGNLYMIIDNYAGSGSVLQNIANNVTGATIELNGSILDFVTTSLPNSIQSLFKTLENKFPGLFASASAGDEDDDSEAINSVAQIPNGHEEGPVVIDVKDSMVSWSDRKFEAGTKAIQSTHCSKFGCIAHTNTGEAFFGPHKYYSKLPINLNIKTLTD